MHERQGVVASLCKAISNAGGNIVAQESSVIDHLDHHVVHMTVDCSPMGRSRTHASDKQNDHRLSEFQTICATSDSRHHRLVASIIAQCGEDLHWSSRPCSPNMRLAPLNDNAAELYHAVSGTAAVVRRRATASKPAGYNYVQLPDSIIAKIETQLDIHDQALKCILLSQTVERTLRIVFPHPDIHSRLVHIGFAHLDAPGTLSDIASAIASSGFNILTSILRKTYKDNQNVWEVWLENTRDNDRVPGGAGGIDTRLSLKWVHRRMSTAQSGHYNRLLAARHVELVSPAYPLPSLDRHARKNTAGSLNAKNAPLPFKTKAISPRPRISVSQNDSESLKRTRDQIRYLDQPNSSQEVIERLGTLRAVETFFDPKARPTLFLSVPRTFQTQAMRFAADMHDRGFLVDCYVVADGTPILSSVIDHIRRSDFFVGIWHCMARTTGKRRKRVQRDLNPWLPFELGVARAMGKPWTYVASDILHEDVVRSLADGRSIPTFDFDSPEATQRAFNHLIKLITTELPAAANSGHTKKRRPQRRLRQQ